MLIVPVSALNEHTGLEGICKVEIYIYMYFYYIQLHEEFIVNIHVCVLRFKVGIMYLCLNKSLLNGVKVKLGMPQLYGVQVDQLKLLRFRFSVTTLWSTLEEHIGPLES